MDNVKIGKLISKLRKQKGLTQQELADMVGIGNQAVSKWERGLTIPDISIINELSKILEISSDELLKGELEPTYNTITNSKENITNNKENKINKNFSKKVLITIFVILISFILYLIITSYLNNKTYKYELQSTSEEYNIEGYVELHQDNLTLVIDNLEFNDKELLNTEITRYDYQIMIGNKLIFGYANNNESKFVETASNVSEFLEEFKINYNVNINKKDKIKENMNIYISFQTKDYIVIIKELNINLKK